ncbi:MAG: hypothetical protein MUC87_14160 [Bacteroidia bacterium]|jgi:hypothetical protein|nr:hypothetical protein [Bacteroidia bacterium]
MHDQSVHKPISARDSISFNGSSEGASYPAVSEIQENIAAQMKSLAGNNKYSYQPSAGYFHAGETGVHSPAVLPTAQMQQAGVIQRTVSVGGQAYNFAQIVNLFANDAEIGWDDDWEHTLRTIVNLEKAHNFASLKALEEFLMNAEIHEQVSDMLGFPLNWDSQSVYGKPQPENAFEDPAHAELIIAGQAVALRILNLLKNERAKTLKEPEGSLRWIAFYAASGAVTETGVCDNFGSLAAMLLRIEGREEVSAVNVGGHVIASVGGKKVDAWENLVHSDNPAPDDAPLTTAIDVTPEEAAALLREEIATCDTLMEKIYDTLTQAEKEQYAFLLAKRDTGEWGALRSRAVIARQLEIARAERMARRRGGAASAAASAAAPAASTAAPFASSDHKSKK